MTSSDSTIITEHTAEVTAEELTQYQRWQVPNIDNVTVEDIDEAGHQAGHHATDSLGYLMKMFGQNAKEYVATDPKYWRSNDLGFGFFNL